MLTTGPLVQFVGPFLLVVHRTVGPPHAVAHWHHGASGAMWRARVASC